MIVPIAKIAALDECMTAVDMATVNKYRALDPKTCPPIKLRPVNAQGYYVIDDGHHRIMAAMLSGREYITAEADPTQTRIDISWRYPRVAPVSHTWELMKLDGTIK